MAAKRKFWPIIGATATTIAVFLPLLFLSNFTDFKCGNIINNWGANWFINHPTAVWNRDVWNRSNCFSWYCGQQ